MKEYHKGEIHVDAKELRSGKLLFFDLYDGSSDL